MESKITATAPITELLRLTREGNGEAQEHLFGLIFGQLRRIAASRLRRERRRAELEPTELVNEAYFLLFGERDRAFANRNHFLAVAARAMHCILIDLARKRQAAKRGFDFQRVTFGDWIPGQEENAVERLLLFEEVLRRLEEFDKRAAQIVELKVFVGLTFEEIGDVVGLSARTVKRDYQAAKCWLSAELSLPRQTNGMGA